MQLTVQGKQLDLGDALREHVTEKIEDINQKFFNHATSGSVTFSREGHGHGLIRAHISIRVGKNIMVMADSVQADSYVAFDSAVEKVGTQLRRYKTRLRDHQQRLEDEPGDAVTARSYVLASEETEEMKRGDDPVVIAEMTTDIQTMSVSEAVMRLDLGDQPAMLFRNASHDGLNMVYRRPDGNVGWVDPIGNAQKKAAPVKAKIVPKAVPKAKPAVKTMSKTKTKTPAKKTAAKAPAKAKAKKRAKG